MFDDNRLGLCLVLLFSLHSVPYGMQPVDLSTSTRLNASTIYKFFAISSV